MTMAAPNQPERSFSPTGLLAQLSNVVNRSAYEDTVVWAIFGTFWAANALLLVALFSQGDFPRHSAVGIIISAAGTIVSVAWFLIQRRAIGHLKRYEDIIAAIEEELGIPADFRLSGDRHRENFRGVAARKVMREITRLSVIGWGVGLGCFAWDAIGRPVPW
jgi:hypothetical protein